MNIDAPQPDMELSGQTALVTGASSGLGRRFATVLAAAGARVVAAARRRDRLEQLVAEIRAAGGVAEALTLDVADAHAIPAAVEAAEALLGPIRILVNNAGVAHLQPALTQEVALIDAMLATNVRAPFLLAREVARRLIERGLPGRIVNVSSMGAFTSSSTFPATLYSTTKASLVRMTELLAGEWARQRINVNAIAPGFFRSEMSEEAIRLRGDAITQGMPRRRFGEPHQLDSTLLYLVSPRSEFVTGTCIKVDDAQMTR
jgi:NAD(P)-dependent dehydrogenase (short-subunit alcohol dehydrogenase family)